MRGFGNRSPLHFLLLALLFVALTAIVACDQFERRALPTEPGGETVSLTVMDGDPTLPADGLSTLRLLASVPSGLSEEGRSIRFSTTGGTLLGTLSNGMLIQPLDAQGRATAKLRSSRVPGPVTVSAQLLDGQDPVSVATRLEVTFVPGDETRLLSFTEAPGTAPADGATASEFAVRVGEQFAGDLRKVLFTTTGGSFSLDASSQSKEVEAGTDRTARIFLYSPTKAGPALVTASLSGFQTDTRIDFRSAPADEILVTLESLTIAQDGTLEVTATLLRRIGTPTEGTLVEFDALDSSGASFGIFRNIQRSRADGTASAVFDPDGEGTPGSAVIIVTADGSSAEGRANFELTEPPPAS